MKVEEGIPIPPLVQKGVRTTKYPRNKMKVGSSFFVPAPKGVIPKVTAQRVRNSATARQKKGKERYVVREMKDGARCWRIK